MRHASLRFLAALFAALALLSTLPSCGGGSEVRVGINQPPPPAATGALTVTVANLPTGANAAVRVIGPGGFSRDLIRTETLTGLVAGTYTISAGPVTIGTVTYTPSMATQTITVANATASASVAYAAAPLVLATSVFASGLDRPMFLTAPPNDARQFIVERAGRIRVVQGGNLLSTAFLDISARVSTDGEGGLLSMAFDPAYATSGAFYIYYTDTRHDIVVERHTVSGNPNLANSTGYLEIIRIPHPTFTNHYGGQVAFGPDGFLYLATGDGGGAGDPSGNAQNNAVLLGKLLRLDVSTASASVPYRIPPSNPYAGQAGMRGEIWANGLRNPWRFAFDASRLYIADVGQNEREEVNVVEAGMAGVNYGWDIMEGSACFGASGCNTAGLTQPVLDYLHASTAGCSITGGYVYRGRAIPELAGHYFYSDFCAGFLRSFTWNGTAATQQTNWPVVALAGVVSFGQDAEGELYIVSQNGTVWKLVRAAATP